MTRGEKIKTAREKCGMSQTMLADKIGVSKQTMYKYESNIVTNIPTDKIEAIAVACHCTPEYLMGWEETAISSTHQKLHAAIDSMSDAQAEALYQLLQTWQSMREKP